MKIYFKKDNFIADFSDTKHFNITNAEEIQKYLTHFIENHPRHFILDLQNIRFIDCQGISCLITLHQIANNNHSTLTICGLSAEAQLLIHTLKLSSILNIKKNINT